MPFKSLNLQLQENIASMGYEVATPIQIKAIPLILSSRDVVGASMTGTGKTGAYGLPILSMMLKSGRDETQISKAKMLVLVPTRELSLQITIALREYAKGTDLRILNIAGGANMSKQIASIQKGCDIIVATAGRLLKLGKQGHISLSKIEFFVLDEADTILDLGFIREVEQIIDILPQKRQTLLFSATMTPAVKKLSQEILKKPMLVEVNNLRASDITIEQIVHPIEKEKKLELLSYLLGSNNYPQVLVFTRTKAIANEVSAYLKASGLACDTIHGDKKRGARDRALKDFRSGESKILVATDIACRGLDIDDLGVVVNYDIPHIPLDYIHRIGRTGRAGKNGVAITLLATNEHISWKKIEKLLDKKPQVVGVEGFESAMKLSVVKTRGKSLEKEVEPKKKTAGAFGNKKKKEAPKSKYPTKRDFRNSPVENTKDNKRAKKSK
ncbi:MAG: RNA helicase [Sulfurovum sp. AS07-7]|nr:MAG: RNA helicase [Sulfurovum sp. AS07-7]